MKFQLEVKDTDCILIQDSVLQIPIPLRVLAPAALGLSQLCSRGGAGLWLSRGTDFMSKCEKLSLMASIL